MAAKVTLYLTFFKAWKVTVKKKPRLPYLEDTDTIKIFYY